MPRGIYPRNQSGWHTSDATKKKLSEALKGNTHGFQKGKKAKNWNGFKKGIIPWNKGIKTGHTPWNKGLSGYKNYYPKNRKTHICSEESKQKLRLIQIGKSRPQTSNEKHGNWKGDNCSYRSLHSWVTRWKGKPIKCEHCGKLKTTPKSIHWANISGEYKRELTDWISLCVKCHKHYDGYGVEN